MLGRIRNILPGVGQGTSKPSQNAPVLQKGGPAQAVGKRRALGDITNAHESQAVETIVCKTNSQKLDEQSSCFDITNYKK